MRILLSITFLCLNFYFFAQRDQQRYIDSDLIATKLDSLKLEFPLVENAPKEYELAIYAALEYYPELCDNKIKFKQKKIKTTLNARPTMKSLLYKRRGKRVYVVRINNSYKRPEIITLDKVSFNAQVGVIGHEFNHFLDYSKRSIFQMVDRAFDYVTDKRKAKFEKDIDTQTILRGLGWQTYDWCHYVQYESQATEEYLAFKRKIYLGPEDVLAIMGVDKPQ